MNSLVAVALTPEERRLQTLLRVLAFAFTLAIFAYLLPALGIFGPTLQRFYVQLPFVTNSVVKIGTLALLAFFAAADVRRFRLLTSLLIAAHLISELAMLAVLLWGQAQTPVTLPAPVGTVPVRNLLVGAMVLDGLILILLAWFATSADRARHQLQYFSPRQFRTLRAVAEVVIAGADERLTADDVARNTDRYLGSFDARSKWLSRVVMVGLELYPLVTLKAPFSYLSREARLEFLKKRFYEDAARRLQPEFMRMLIQAAIRMAKQLCYLGYYGDERAHASIGYVPFSRRPDTKAKLAASPAVVRKPLHVIKPAEVDDETLTGDVVIIGSGAAASILAHNLVRAGREVLMLERGKHVDPAEFSENEIDMLSRLYADGAFQLSRDFRFQVLQGSCVGGTTVVNNAVCFRLPNEVLQRWNGGLNAQLNAERLTSSFAHVEKLIGVSTQNHAHLNKGAEVFGAGVSALGHDRPPNRYAPVDANIRQCLGCGYCNIGCAYGRKLSMLDSVLPIAQEMFGREALRIVSECEAIKLKGRGSQITGVLCQLTDGRRIEVRGKTFIVAAGAISSSLLLLRSNVGGKNVGRRVSFNMGSPLHARFREKLNAYEGLQISHALQFAPNRGFILETWYNPPVAQALVMPGWFEDHFRNMRSYDRMSAVGVLVGTEPNAVVTRRGLFGREIAFTPSIIDLHKILDGLIVTGEAFLAAGAEAVMPATFSYQEYRNPADLARIRTDVRDASELTLGTGHPMGGNAVSADARMGVVDPEFKVYGYSNLHVCDASVFPTAIGVNPQLTVMALADYASQQIAGSAAPARPAVASGLVGVGVAV
ncbi:MAG TPA: GMC family oxidoreductase [Longimicrobiales bacterium]